MSNITVAILAVDPLALILCNEIYVKLTLPDPPPFEVPVKRLAPVLRELSAIERNVRRFAPAPNRLWHMPSPRRRR